MLINEIIKYFNDLMSNNEPLMKFVFMKSDLITKRERKTERKEAFGPT
jgi:gluconate kinase